MATMTATEGFITVPFPHSIPLHEYVPHGYKLSRQIPTYALSTAQQGYIRIPVESTTTRFLPSARAPLAVIVFAVAVSSIAFPLTFLLAACLAA